MRCFLCLKFVCNLIQRRLLKHTHISVHLDYSRIMFWPATESNSTSELAVFLFQTTTQFAHFFPFPLQTATTLAAFPCDHLKIKFLSHFVQSLHSNGFPEETICIRRIHLKWFFRTEQEKKFCKFDLFFSSAQANAIFFSFINLTPKWTLTLTGIRFRRNTVRRKGLRFVFEAHNFAIDIKWMQMCASLLPKIKKLFTCSHWIAVENSLVLAFAQQREMQTNPG